VWPPAIDKTLRRNIEPSTFARSGSWPQLLNQSKLLARRRNLLNNKPWSPAPLRSQHRQLRASLCGGGFGTSTRDARDGQHCGHACADTLAEGGRHLQRPSRGHGSKVARPERRAGTFPPDTLSSSAVQRRLWVFSPNWNSAASGNRLPESDAQCPFIYFWTSATAPAFVDHGAEKAETPCASPLTSVNDALYLQGLGPA